MSAWAAEQGLADLAEVGVPWKPSVEWGAGPEGAGLRKSSLRTILENRQADTQTHGHSNKKSHRHTHKQTHRQRRSLISL